jgi:hypothetical protein
VGAGFHDPALNEEIAQSFQRNQASMVMRNRMKSTLIYTNL